MTEPHDIRQPDSERRWFVNEINEFCELASAPGLNRFGVSSKAWRRALWVIFILGVYAGFGFNFSVLYDRYTSTPLLTTLSISLPFEFPDVYICPSNAVSMSKAYQPLMDDSEVQKLQFVGRDTSCDNLCKAKASYFDISNVPLSGSYSALSAAISAVGMQMLAGSNQAVRFQHCRYSSSGFEYTGNRSSVTIYSSNLVVRRPPDNISNAPYVTQRQCIPWNTAARQLKTAGVSTLSESILALNYSNDDARCRNPIGLQLGSLDGFISSQSGTEFCYEDDPKARLFNYSCFDIPLRSISSATCAQCCYNRRFSYMGLQNRTCYCSNTIIESKKVEPGLCPIICSEEGYIATCGGIGTYMTVTQVRNLDAPIFTEYVDYFVQYLTTGPYCFYTDIVNGLAVLPCSVSFCPTPENYDCDPGILSIGSTVYSGKRDLTSEGFICMVWSDVKRGVENSTWTLADLEPRMDIKFDNYSIDQLIVLSADSELLRGSINYCRDVLVMYDITYYRDRKPIASSRDKLLPIYSGCFYLMTAARQVKLARCSVENCLETHPIVSGVVRNRVGGTQLARHFSNSLDIGLVSCKFNEKACNLSNFEALLHPELGVCYRFEKEPFLSNLSQGEIADAVLEVQIFTDILDSNGKNAYLGGSLSKAISGSISSRNIFDSKAFDVIMVPDGEFPWSSRAFGVQKAQKAELKLLHEKTNRFSKPPSRECIQETQSILYMIDFWEPNIFSNQLTLMMEKLYRYTGTGNWIIKADQLKELLANTSYLTKPIIKGKYFRSVQDDCISEFVLRKFADNCKCLPTFLPIPEHLYNSYPICFNWTVDLDALLIVDQCYSNQQRQISNYRHQAWGKCKPQCQSRQYSVTHNSYSWPNVRRATSNNLFNNILLDAVHFGTDIVSFPRTRGPLSVVAAWYSYLHLGDLASALGTADALTLSNFDNQLNSIQDQLATVSISAARMFGQEVTEEEAYPLNSFLAEVGGTIGLWCGVCVLTLCELLELILKLALALIGTPRRTDFKLKAALTEVKKNDVHQVSGAECLETSHF